MVYDMRQTRYRGAPNRIYCLWAPDCDATVHRWLNEPCCLSNVHAVTYIHLIVSVTLQSAAKVLTFENILEDIVTIANAHLFEFFELNWIFLFNTISTVEYKFSVGLHGNNVINAVERKYIVSGAHIVHCWTLLGTNWKCWRGMQEVWTYE